MIMAGSEEEKFDHPTQKPVVLLETARSEPPPAGERVRPVRWVRARRSSRRSSSAGAAMRLEIEPRYVQVCIERWQGFTGREAVRLDG